MVDTVSEFQQVFLTYKDVAEANPNWTDRMVEDYLATKRDIGIATNTADKAVNTSTAAVMTPALIKQVDRITFDIVTVGSDYTTYRNQILICRNATPITITLNPYPRLFEEVHVKRRDAELTIAGLIDGLTDITLNVPNYSVHLVYDGQDWSVI
jgi:hypothetical protein